MTVSRVLGINLLVAVVVCCHPGSVVAVSCPGEESDLPKSKAGTNLTLHPGGYTLSYYADYPLNWPECYWEFEDAGFDSHDKTESLGFLAYANCTENVSTTTFAESVGVSISATLSGKGAIARELGWKTSGTVKYGDSAEFGWEVNVTGSGSASISDSDHAAHTHYFWYPYVQWAFRKGAEYTYWQGTVRVWCDVCDNWVNEHPDQVDYYSDEVATVKYVAGHGIQERSCTPCPCSAPFLEQTFGVTSPPKITYTPGANWYDD